MYDIFLSTPSSTPSGAGAAGLTVGGAQGAGAHSTGENNSFGATLTGVFHSVLSPEKLDEISTKLESLGMDTSFLDDVNSLLSGNLLTMEGAREGMALPQLSSFLQSSLAELEKMLSGNMLESGENSSTQLSEDILASLGGIIDSIQQTVEPVKSQGAMVFGLPGSTDGVSVSMASAGVMQSSEHARQITQGGAQVQGNVNAATPATMSAQSGVQGAELDNRSFTTMGGGPSNTGDQTSLLPAGERAFSNTLDDQFSKLLNSDAPSDSNIEGMIDKLNASVKDRSSASGLRTTFSEAQLKLENAPYSTTVMTGLDDIAWGEEVGQKIVWLTGKAIQSAEIHLNPAELGPIDVKISVQNDAAAVTFNAHNASVREMLESNVVRLREMMETNGVDLQEVNVDARQGDQGFASQDQQQGGSGDSEQGDDADSSMDDALEREEIVQSSSNLVDYFA